MKSLIPFVVACFFYFTSSAQTNTFTSTSNQNWTTVANWSLGVLPTSAHDVIISSGSTITINQNVSVKTLTVQNTATVILSGGQDVNLLNASTFALGSTFNWVYGTIKGGSTVNFNGTVNLSSANHKFLKEYTTINNNGLITIQGGGNFYLSPGSINNLTTGIINLQSTSGGTIYSGTNADPNILTNTGLIKKSSTGTTVIDAQLKNNSGTILVESGVLTFSGRAKTLTNGIYNVVADARLDWNTEIICSGTLTGALNGAIFCSTSTITVPVAATFNFTGTTGVLWNYLDFEGGGTLTNKSKITFTSASHKFIKGYSTLRNEGTISFEGAGNLYIYAGILNNIGTLNLKTAGSHIIGTAGTHTFNNTGTIKRTTSGAMNIDAELHNNGGTISVEQGTITLTGSSKFFTDGIYNVATDARLHWNTEVVCAGTLTGLLNGDIFCSTSSIKVPTATIANFNFTGSTGVVWNYLDITGGGTLVNKSKITLLSASHKFIKENTTVLNEGTMNFAGAGNLYIYDGALNNVGIIDLQMANASIVGTAGSHIFNNTSIIKRTTPGAATIDAELHNNAGTISVEQGSIIFNGSSKYLTNGIYNVATNARLWWNTEIICAGTLTGLLNGDIFCGGSNIKIPLNTTANFNFTGSTGVVWSALDVIGGGTLVNKSKITFLDASHKFIKENTTVLNEGTMNLEGAGNLYIYAGNLTNEGTIDFKLAGCAINGTAGTHEFTNTGTIKQSCPGGVAINAALYNNEGTITVNQGTMTFNGLQKSLKSGIYNVANNARLHWNTDILCEGTMTGLLDGDIFCSTSSTKVLLNKTATFDFTGTTGVIWNYLDINGPRTLINKSKLTLLSASHKFLQEGITFNNEGTMTFEGSGNLYLYNGTVNNQLPGIMDFKALAGNFSVGTSGAHILNNFGLIKSTSNADVFIYPATTNSGTIDVMSGKIKFTGAEGFTNTATGIIKGVGTLGVPASAYFTNNGIFAPGATTGKLNVSGDFKSTSSSVLQIELFGNSQSINYDVLAIQGNGIFNGTIAIELGFQPVLNNEFIIATTTGTISQCALPTSILASYNGYNYTFSVLCRNNNEVVLKVTNVVLETAENNLIPLTLYPNPNNGQFTIDLGKEFSNINVEIYNMLGQVISKSQYPSGSRFSEDINSASGIYFVKVTTDGNESKMIRVIKR